jgi:hypothetical protein
VWSAGAQVGAHEGFGKSVGGAVAGGAAEGVLGVVDGLDAGNRLDVVVVAVDSAQPVWALSA